MTYTDTWPYNIHAQADTGRDLGTDMQRWHLRGRRQGEADADTHRFFMSLGLWEGCREG